VHEARGYRLFEREAQGLHVYACERFASCSQAGASTLPQIFLPRGSSDGRNLAQVPKPLPGEWKPAEGATRFERRQQQVTPACSLDFTQGSRERLSVEARFERDEPLRDDPELANVWDGKRKPPVMRAKLAEEGRAGLDRCSVRFGVVDACDLLVPVREHAGFPTVAEERTRIDAQLLEDTQQRRITEQVHRIDV
jgi:hypothetical protein